MNSAKKSSSEAVEAKADGKAPSFEEALGRLEQIVGDLEDGPLGLAESLACYEEGIRCLKQCYGTLEQAERKIEMLAGVDAQGQPVVEPMSDDTLSLEEKAAARSRRRSRTTRSTDTSGESTAAEEDRGEDDTIDRGRSLF